jgi:hypothetical protein
LGGKLATDIANRLQYDFGPLFQTVRVGPPLGRPDELLVTGRISDYQPGTRVARLFGPGIGKADLKGEVVLKDGATFQPQVIAPIDKLWAWGDIIGASKGMNDMVEETAAATANLIARSKGWESEPPMGATSSPWRTIPKIRTGLKGSPSNHDVVASRGALFLGLIPDRGARDGSCRVMVEKMKAG